MTRINSAARRSRCGSGRSTAVRLARCAAAALLAAGCGGQGGGGSGGDDGFSVSPGELTFAADEQASLPPPQALRMTVSNPAAAYFGAGFNGADPGWASVGSGTLSGATITIPVGVKSTNLAPGRYEATLTVGIADASQKILATRAVPIHYTVAARFRVLTSALAFIAHEVGGPPAGQSISVSGTGFAWNATASEPWIHLGASAGTGTGTLTVSVDHGGLSPGVHVGQVTVRAGGEAFQVPVSLQVDAAAFAATGSLTWSGVNGTALGAKSLPVSLRGGGLVAWTAQADAPWIVLEKSAGSTPDAIAVQVDPSRGPLPSGSHAGRITLSATVNGRAFALDVPVGLTLTRPVLTVTPAVLALGGETGRDLAARPASLSLSTGTAAFAWGASASSQWAVPSATAGTVSSTPAAFTVTPNPGGLAAGTHTTTIDFSAVVNGDRLTASLTVVLDVDARRLLASDTGVAFAKTPGLARLTRTLAVRDNFGAATPWEAAADQPWLKVTASGTAPGELVLTADPTGLAADALHEATVMVTPAMDDGRPAEVVKVGLWVGSANPAAATTLVISGQRYLAVDPVRPYAYVHSGGTAIAVYNVYTEQVVGTISSVAAQLGDMTISNDGATLYASDRTSFRIVPVDLATRTVGTPFLVGNAPGPALQYVRSNGRGLVLASNGCIWDAVSGALAFPTGGCTSTTFAVPAASLRGNIFSLDRVARSLDTTVAGGGRVLVGPPRFAAVTAWNSADYAFDEDGTRMYLAVGAPYDFYVADCTGTAQSMPHVQTLPGEPYPNNIEVARDGRIFAGSNPYGKNAFIYAPDGTQLASWQIAYYGPTTRAMKVSGDGLRLLAIVEATSPGVTTLNFTTVAP